MLQFLKTQQLHRREMPVFWVSSTVFGEGGEATDLITYLSENCSITGRFLNNSDLNLSLLNPGFG